jgi:hypothetical protein
MKKFLSVVVCIFVVTFFVQAVYAEEKKLSDSSKRMVDSLAALAMINPGIAMDTPSKMFGDYSCFHLTKGMGNMVHFAKNPGNDDADIILLVDAEALIGQGLKVAEFPQLKEPPFGPGLTSGQWYFMEKFNLIVLPLKIEDAGYTGKIVPKVK